MTEYAFADRPVLSKGSKTRFEVCQAQDQEVGAKTCVHEDLGNTALFVCSQIKRAVLLPEGQ